jgi:hypothetical protein
MSLMTDSSLIREWPWWQTPVCWDKRMTLMTDSSLIREWPWWQFRVMFYGVYGVSAIFHLYHGVSGRGNWKKPVTKHYLIKLYQVTPHHWNQIDFSDDRHWFHRYKCKNKYHMMMVLIVPQHFSINYCITGNFCGILRSTLDRRN